MAKAFRKLQHYHTFQPLVAASFGTKDGLLVTRLLPDSTVVTDWVSPDGSHRVPAVPGWWIKKNAPSLAH